MEIAIFTQPFDSDGVSKQFGLVLIDLLNSNEPFYNQIWIISAFANEGAVARLVPHLETVVSQGATVRITLGFDHQSTSIEALQAILALNLEAKIVHNNQPGHTFHPKIYLFEAEGEKAELFIGSHNLTAGGLFTNYEASIHMTFNFPADQQEYVNFKRALDRFMNPPEAIWSTPSLME